MASDPPNQPSRGDAPDPATGEADLDAVLAEASEAAAELGRELGADESRPPTATEHRAEEAEATSVDAQLDEIEALLGETGERLGADEPAEAEDPDPGQPDERAEAASPAADEPPADLDPGERPEADPAAATDTDPGGGYDVTDDDLDMFEGSVPEFDDGDTPPPRHEDHAPAEDRPADSETLPPATTAARAGLLLRAGDRLADLLELMDRPFGWVGEDARRIIGFVALATMTVAVGWLTVSQFL